MGGPSKAVQPQALFGLYATPLQGSVADNSCTQKRGGLHGGEHSGQGVYKCLRSDNIFGIATVFGIASKLWLLA